MWNFLSPIALFASAKVHGEYSNELVPVAIQMDYKPGSVNEKNIHLYQHLLEPAQLLLFFPTIVSLPLRLHLT